MPKIVICEKAEDISNLSTDSIAIINRDSLTSLLNQEKVGRLKDILDVLKKEPSQNPIHCFDFSKSEIENHQIIEELRKNNKKVKVFFDKIIPLDLLQALLDADILPVIIICPKAVN